MSLISLEFTPTGVNKFVYLDPDIPRISDYISNLDVTVKRYSNHYEDEVSGTIVLYQGEYRVRVNVLDLTPGLYQLQSKCEMGRYVWYGCKESFRQNRRLTG